jgi:hypothetical protein
MSEHKCETCGHWSLCEDCGNCACCTMRRIAQLEAVAEAAEAEERYIAEMNQYPTQQARIGKLQALHAAGYLQEEGK